MTARADISNHRRKVLEERSADLRAQLREARLTAANESQRADHAERELARRKCTAWEKGEALPPFYREVLEEGVRRGDVVPGTCEGVLALERASVQLAIERGDVVSREDCVKLETQLREAESQLHHYGAHPPRYKSQMEKDYGRLEGQLRGAEERIERARNALEALGPNPAGSDPVSVALSILAGTEKEGDRE